MKEYLPLIIGLGGPILVAIGGIISWFLKARKEELQAIEEKAMVRRIEIYNQILHPLVVLFASKATEEDKEAAIAELGSTEYRKAAFNLITFGSDEMVNAYNEMMQSFFKNEAEKAPRLTMKKFAAFILAIRKDVYTKETKLKEWDMLKFMITDIDKFID